MLALCANCSLAERLPCCRPLQNHRIRTVNSSTNIISTIAGNATNLGSSGGGYEGDGGPSISAFLKAPHGLALKDGSTAEYYIADTSNSRIRVVRDGVINTLAYNTSFLGSVFGVTLDGAGSLYATTRVGSGQVGSGTGNGQLARL
jgi:hypothetical protein